MPNSLAGSDPADSADSTCDGPACDARASCAKAELPQFWQYFRRSQCKPLVPLFKGTDSLALIVSARVRRGGLCGELATGT